MYEQIKTLFIDEMQIEESKITKDAELMNDLGLNSLELAELIVHCEENFGIEIDEETAKNFVTIGDVVKYLEEATA